MLVDNGEDEVKTHTSMADILAVLECRREDVEAVEEVEDVKVDMVDPFEYVEGYIRPPLLLPPAEPDVTVASLTRDELMALMELEPEEEDIGDNTSRPELRIIGSVEDDRPHRANKRDRITECFPAAPTKRRRRT
jgi:hypothetical protein